MSTLATPLPRSGTIRTNTANGTSNLTTKWASTLNTGTPILLHESVVKDSEIDTLGHLNIRFYVERATCAQAALIRKIGISPENASGQTLRRVDTYSRFHREQFTGAPLNTYGGFIRTERADDKGGLTTYLEIRNVERNEIACSFIMTSILVENTSQRLLAIDADEDARSDLTIALPDHGRPRSISLAPPTPVSLSELDAVIPNDLEPSEFHGRREGTVQADDCDEYGRLKEELDPLFVLFKTVVEKETRNAGPTIMTDASGRRFSWAMIEARTTNQRRPESGETIVSMNADLNFGENWRQTRRWLFSKNSFELFGISDYIGMCIDVDARKSIPIPDDVRKELESAALPQFL